MRSERWAIVAVGSATIVGAGIVAAPQQINMPVGDDDAGAQASPEVPAVVTPGAEAPASMDPDLTGVFDGPPITNLRGTYQAQIIIRDGVVVDVIALQAGTDAPESVAVNTVAIPLLRERVLNAQSADVDAVSGASFTSPAFIESLEGAFAAAQQE